MNKVKEFCKKHKKKIIVGGCVIGAGIIGGLLIKGSKKKLLDVTGKSYLTWRHNPEDGFMNLERVKEILDLNANNTSKFAIYREGVDPNNYLCIMISDDVKLV